MYDGEPDYLNEDQIRERGGDPAELIRQGIMPLTGHNGRQCWPWDQVRDWLG